MKTVSVRGALVVVLAVAAVLLTAAGGFCVFDTDGHDHDGVGLDLCIAMAVVPVSVLFIALGLVGGATARPGWAATPAVVSVLDPPPWR